MSSSYVGVSGSIFAVVAIAHIARLLTRAPVKVGSFSVPMAASWIGLPVSALLAIWAFVQFGH
jgi:hypothetical protein